MKTRIRARYVIGFDGIDHVIFERGEVVYADDTIVFVGHAYRDAVDRVIDAGDAVVSPGFIDLDALADIDHGILDTWQPAELGLGLQWSREYFDHQRRDVFTRDEKTRMRRYALVQLLLNGVTTAMPIAGEMHQQWCETYEELVDMATVGAELGLRLYLGPSYRSGVNVVNADGSRDVAWDLPLGEDGLRQAVDFINHLTELRNPRLTGALLPCRIETCTLDLLRETARHAADLGVLTRIHAAQSQLEVKMMEDRHGRRSIELLADVGLLGPRTSIPHVLYATNQELGLLADSGTTVIHCPLTSIRQGRALDSFDGYRSAGINVAMGTDTFPPDMLRVLDYGSNLNKLMRHDQSTGTAADLFRAATLGGARALGRVDLGRLAPGAKADIVVFDLSGLRTGPIDDPLRTLLLNAGGYVVRDVIVDGQPVVVDSQIPGLDVEAVRVAGQAHFDTMKAAYAERDYKKRPATALFRSSLRVVERDMP